MTTKEVLESVAAMPMEEWSKIQEGIAEMILKKFNAGEITEIGRSLEEADEDFARGDFVTSEEIDREFGLE
jgi:hypothetical protein